jgi:hypothetical protein
MNLEEELLELVEVLELELQLLHLQAHNLSVPKSN